MLGSVGSVVPKRWILGIFALGMIAIMVATSASPWAEAAAVPTSVTSTALSPTSIQVDWTPSDPGSTVPGSGVIDAYSVECNTGTPVVVTGIGTSTATITGLTANTAYVCTVKASSTSTLPGSGVSAASITTPVSLATQLGSVVISPASASVQVGGGQVISGSSKGADTGKTAITGLTVNWSITGNGSLNGATTGNSVTYTATSAGSAAITASVTQAATGITKTIVANITNFTPPADTSTPQGSDPSDPTDVPTPPSLGGNTQASTGVVQPSQGATLAVPAPAAGNTKFNFPTSGTVAIPVNAVPSGSAFAVIAELIPRTGGTTVAPTLVRQESFVPLPGGVVAVDAEPLTVQFANSAGTEVKGVTLNAPADISLSVPTGNIINSGRDAASVAIYKASDPSVGPWSELTTSFSIVGGQYKFQANTSNFSTFILGSKTREVGGAGAVLPSAGDIAPTTTQAILVTTMGLLLVVGGGAYIRRQRKAAGTE